MSAKLPGKKKTAPVASPTEADAPVVWVDVRQLVPNPRNPNRHTEATFQTIRASVEASGFTGAIVTWTECDEPRPAEAGPGPVYLLGHGHARRIVMQALWAEKPDYQIAGSPGPGFLPVRLMSWSSREACDAYLIAANQTGKATTWDRGALERLRQDSAQRDWPYTKAALLSLPVLTRPGPPPIVAPSLPSLVRPPPPPEVLAKKQSPPPPDAWNVFGMPIPVTLTEHADMMAALEEYQQAQGTYSGAGDHLARAVTEALAALTAQGAQASG